MESQSWDWNQSAKPSEPMVAKIQKGMAGILEALEKQRAVRGKETPMTISELRTMKAVLQERAPSE